MLQPIRDRVLVRRSNAEEKTPGGLIVPDSAKEKLPEGTVLAVGSGMILPDGTSAGLEVEPGDVVIFQKGAGVEVITEFLPGIPSIERSGTQALLLLREVDILCIRKRAS